jgi:hypothetical protein
MGRLLPECSDNVRASATALTESAHDKATVDALGIQVSKS